MSKIPAILFLLEKGVGGSGRAKGRKGVDVSYVGVVVDSPCLQLGGCR